MNTVDSRPSSASQFPSAKLSALDTLWFQVAGTVCNLQCHHCFISCSPSNHSHEMMGLKEIEPYLQEAKELGVKEYYFTGGEPFLNPEMLSILECTLKQGPASVLTNGTLLTQATCDKIKQLSDESDYSLDIRISIDGYNAESNDPIRGEGTYERIIKGIERLAATGLSPVITVTEALEEAASIEGRKRFLEFLKGMGLKQARLKILPLLHLGAEKSRSRAYEKWESLLGRDLNGDEAGLLQCSTCRMVTAKGVYVCPLLIDFSSAKMGETLKETQGAFELKHQACFTCYETGFSCRT